MWWRVIGGVFAFLSLVALLLRRLVRTGGSLWKALPVARIVEGAMRGRTVVVTGGTSGIGLEVVKGLARADATLVLACVTLEEGERAKEALLALRHAEVCVVDLRRGDSIVAFVRRMEGRGVDALVHVAGVSGDVCSMVRVNFLGPAQLIQLLAPHMREDARIVCVGSDAHQLGRVRMDDFVLHKRWGSLRPSLATVYPVQQAYGTTKLMFIMWCFQMARQTGRSIHIVQPGFVNTPIGEQALAAGSLAHRLVRAVKSFFAKTPWEGAQTVLHVALSDDIPCDKGVVRAWANNAPWRFWNDQINQADLRARVYEEAPRWFAEGTVERVYGH